MLSFSSEQFERLRLQRYSNNHESIKNELELSYNRLVKHPANGKIAEFSAWFAAQVTQCNQFNIKKNNNIKSFCLAAIHHYPDFPASTRFQHCGVIMLDPDLDEDSKWDKVNYRLLFIR